MLSLPLPLAIRLCNPLANLILLCHVDMVKINSIKKTAFHDLPHYLLQFSRVPLMRTQKVS